MAKPVENDYVFCENDRIALLFISMRTASSAVSLNNFLILFNKNNIPPEEFLLSPEKFKNLPLPEGVAPKNLFVSKDSYKLYLKQIAKLKNYGIRFTFYFEDNYPAYLNYYLDNSSPSFLFFKGNTELMQKPSIAVVGSREPQEWSFQKTVEFSEMLAERGLVIISGMARGIDSAAHLGALKKGQTIIVPGKTMLQNYVTDFCFKLLRDDNYLTISPFYPFEKYRKDMPVRRNRIVSSMCNLAVISECGLVSGTNYVINHSLKIKKRLYAFSKIEDGSDKMPGGNKALLNGKALPVNIDDLKSMEQTADRIAEAALKSYSKIKKDIRGGNYFYIRKKLTEPELPLEFF